MNYEIIYYITCGNRYIMRDATGKYILTTNKHEADTFTDIKTANNVYKSCLNKKLQQMCKVSAITNTSPEKLENTVKNMSNNDLNSLDLDLDLDSVFNDIMNSVRAINSIKDNCMSYIAVLSDNQSLCDRKIVDMEHYIEFNKLNACDGYKAFKALQELLIERRKIKNKLKILIVIKNFIEGNNSLDNVLETINHINNQTYNPRELTYLF